MDLPAAAWNRGFWGLVLAEAEGSAGELAGVLAFVYDYFAVDYDVRDANRGNCLGFSRVAGALTVSGLKMVMSAL